ncbi:MAG: asparaginase [Gemmatimonadota bacterium]
MSSVVDVARGSVIESRHRVSAAVVDAHGRLRASTGEPGLLTYARSAIKPIQALPLVEDGVIDRYEITDQELALCCASHSGEPRHVDAVRAMLRKIGADEDALACGPHAPLGKGAADALATAGRQPGRIHNNCSGKHAGMLALARYYSWPLVGYHHAEHPVQQRMLAELSRWSGVAAEAIPVAVDGCGVTTFALSLEKLAAAFAVFAAAVRRGADAPARIAGAMVRHPEYVAGSRRLCTDLMRVARGRIFLKVGAEGVYLAGIPGAELGIAVKVEDGGPRAAEPALIAVLQALALLTEDEVAQLANYAEPDVLNTRGERVGTIRARIKLEAAK